VLGDAEKVKLEQGERMLTVVHLWFVVLSMQKHWKTFCIFLKRVQLIFTVEMLKELYFRATDLLCNI